MNLPDRAETMEDRLYRRAHAGSSCRFERRCFRQSGKCHSDRAVGTAGTAAAACAAAVCHYDAGRIQSWVVEGAGGSFQCSYWQSLDVAAGQAAGQRVPTSCRSK